MAKKQPGAYPKYMPGGASTQSGFLPDNPNNPPAYPGPTAPPTSPFADDIRDGGPPFEFLGPYQFEVPQVTMPTAPSATARNLAAQERSNILQAGNTQLQQALAGGAYGTTRAGMQATQATAAQLGREASTSARQIYDQDLSRQLEVSLQNASLEMQAQLERLADQRARDLALMEDQLRRDLEAGRLDEQTYLAYLDQMREESIANYLQDLQEFLASQQPTGIIGPHTVKDLIDMFNAGGSNPVNYPNDFGNDLST